METISLNGKWVCKPDLENLGIESEWFIPKNHDRNDNRLVCIEIPKSYNFLEGYNIFEGVFWHFYQFTLTRKKNVEKFNYHIRFKGSNYNTKIWLNGDLVCEHNGGFTPFFFNVSRSIKEDENLLVVRVDNIRRRDGIYALIFDWFNWGGIYRDVEILILNKNRVIDVKIKITLNSIKESRIRITYKIIGNVSLKWQILDNNEKNILLEGILPQILNKPRKNINTKLLGIFLWIILFPFCYFILTHLIPLFIDLVKKGEFKKGSKLLNIPF